MRHGAVIVRPIGSAGVFVAGWGLINTAIRPNAGIGDVRCVVQVGRVKRFERSETEDDWDNRAHEGNGTGKHVHLARIYLQLRWYAW